MSTLRKRLDTVEDRIAIQQHRDLQVVGVRPARADHSDADRALCQRGVDLVAPLADADAVHVAKYALTPKSDAQPVVEPAAGAARVVTAVANEDVVTTRKLSVHRPRCSCAARLDLTAPFLGQEDST